MRNRGSLFVAAACFVAASLVATTALAAPKIYINKGVGGARLNREASYNIGKLGKPSKTAVNKQYPNPNGSGVRTVYIYMWGRSMGGGRYPLIMYALKGANNSKKTFNFSMYSSIYKTTSGVGVGTSEKTLKSKYPSAKRNKASSYTYYTLGKSGGYTVFAVKNSKVFSVTVHR